MPVIETTAASRIRRIGQIYYTLVSRRVPLRGGPQNWGGTLAGFGNVVVKFTQGRSLGRPTLG